MRKLKIGLMTMMLALGLHTSAMAGEVWQEEITIANLNQGSQFTAEGYTYRSSDPSVATVTQDGRVSFHREGTVVISMTQGSVTIHQPYRVAIERVDTAEFRAEVVRLVNLERSRYGLRPLADDTRYQACADIRAEEITKVFSHTRPDGRPCDTVLKDSGVRHPYMGENIAMGQQTPAQVVNDWMNSDGHRANILNGSYTHLAVGCKQGADGSLYWVQIFTKR